MFATGSLVAQTIDYNLGNALDLYRLQKFEAGANRSVVLTENDIEGSPYLNDDFIAGSIYTLSKTKYVDIPLRYNIYNDEIEFQTPDNKILALNVPEIVEKITFGNYTLEYIPFIFGKKVKRGFFKILLHGNASLYARPEVQYVEPKEPAPYKEAQPAKFFPKDDKYYLRFGQEAALLIGNKKDVIAIFPDHKNKIETFIKKNRINVKKPEDMKSLVEYYNSL